MKNYESPVLEAAGSASSLIQLKPSVPDDGSGTGHRPIALDTQLEVE
jgi:hypothetical protein